jgi:hypothetical protein
MLSRFTFLRARFTVRARGPLWFGEYAGSALRGAFGEALFRHYCVFGFVDGCRPACSIAARCGYQYLFKTVPSSPGLRGVTTEAPRPYVLWPALERSEVGVGETFQVYVTLFGRATNELPRVVRAIEEALPQGLGMDRVPCDLVRVELLDEAGTPLCLNGIPAAPPVSTLSLGGSEGANQITVFLDTPLRPKKSDGTFSRALNFSDFWEALTRRISLLGVYHCDVRQEDWHFPAPSKEIRVIGSSLYWTTNREHYSFQQQQRNSLNGWLGSVTFAGELGPYLPYLRLGELTHVGSGCVYGLGKYRVRTEGRG